MESMQAAGRRARRHSIEAGVDQDAYLSQPVVEEVLQRQMRNERIDWKGERFNLFGPDQCSTICVAAVFIVVPYLILLL